MNPQSLNDVKQFIFQNLPPINNLAQSGNLIQNYIKGHNWTDSFNCITQLRKINKYHPEYIPDIIERYSLIILDLLGTGKTLLVKNIFKLIKQLFDAGQQVNVQKAVYAFLPVLIKKASTEIGNLKNFAQEVLTAFSNNCGYQISFVISSEYCSDKNTSVAELSIKLLAALIQKVGPGIMQLTQNTLSLMMKCLSSLIDGKRKNMRSSALDICIFICNQIGSDNYLQLMNYCLTKEEVQSMGTSMQTHRIEKEKPLRLKQAIQNRKTQKFNSQFFNNEKYNNNFIPLPTQNNISNNQNYNYQSYNYNNYNNQNYGNY